VGRLFTVIRALVARGQDVVGEHATDRLEERGILEWQVVDGIERGLFLEERLRESPNPTVEVLQQLPDGTPIKAVWSHLKPVDMAKLVTVHFFDE